MSGPDDYMHRRMARAIRTCLALPDQMCVFRALTEAPDRMVVLFGPYGGMPVTDEEFARLMLRISKQALSPGGAS